MPSPVIGGLQAALTRRRRPRYEPTGPVSESAILAQLVKLSIVPKHVVEREGNDKFNLNPIGSGPYKFISWDRGVAVTLARNDAYWGRKGPFPQAVFRAVPNAATRGNGSRIWTPLPRPLVTGTHCLGYVRWSV